VAVLDSIALPVTSRTGRGRRDEVDALAVARFLARAPRIHAPEAVRELEQRPIARAAGHAFDDGPAVHREALQQRLRLQRCIGKRRFVVHPAFGSTRLGRDARRYSP
jgi:hypothetical protein